jgi:hypothetical protein
MRLFGSLLCALFLGSAQAEPQEPNDTEDAPVGQMPNTSPEGIPLIPGAEATESEGSYQIGASFETVYESYKNQLEAQGFAVRELSRATRSAVWQVSRGDLNATITLDGSTPGKVSIEIDEGIAAPEGESPIGQEPEGDGPQGSLRN